MEAVGHKAGWIMCSPEEWISNGLVTIKDGTVIAVEKAPRTHGKDIVDHGPGVIMPALVNAHTHLSLSCLYGKIKTSDGFLSWIKELMITRMGLQGEDASASAIGSASVMKESGVGLVGEFGPHTSVEEAIAQAGLEGTIWHEFFGNKLQLPELPPDVGAIKQAYAGHAPNTTSPRLLSYIKGKDRQLGKRFCVHLAESEDEVEFLTTGKGNWADFLAEVGSRYSKWDCWGRRPVELADELGLLDNETLAVHLLEVTKSEVQLLAERGAHACLCPRSNSNLHGKLPDIEAFLNAGSLPAIGTDSLASTGTLSIFDEMNFIAEKYSGLRPEEILGMATINGAKAIGRKDIGSIMPGQKAKLIYVDLSSLKKSEIAEKLVSHRDLNVTWVGDEL